MEVTHGSQLGAFGLDIEGGGKEMIDAPMLKQVRSFDTFDIVLIVIVYLRLRKLFGLLKQLVLKYQVLCKVLLVRFGPSQDTSSQISTKTLLASITQSRDKGSETLDWGTISKVIYPESWLFYG
jgi:hypothetical protein